MPGRDVPGFPSTSVTSRTPRGSGGLESVRGRQVPANPFDRRDREEVKLPLRMDGGRQHIEALRIPTGTRCAGCACRRRRTASARQERPADPGVAAHACPARAADQPAETYVRRANAGLTALCRLRALDTGHGVRVLLVGQDRGMPPRAEPRRLGREVTLPPDISRRRYSPWRRGFDVRSSRTVRSGSKCALAARRTPAAAVPVVAGAVSSSGSLGNSPAGACSLHDEKARRSGPSRLAERRSSGQWLPTGSK